MLSHTALTSVLDEFAAVVSDDFQVEDILHQLAHSAMSAMRLDGVGVMVPTSGPELLRVAFATDGPARVMEDLQQQTRAGPCHLAHRTGRAVHVPDMTVEPRWPHSRRAAIEHDLHLTVAVPLQARDRSWGVLDMYRCRPGPMSPEELAAARLLANLAGSYMVITTERDLARIAEARSRTQAVHDHLTGLPMRSMFTEQLIHALLRLERAPGGVAVLFADLDHLKRTNDAHSHAVGDQLLVDSASRIAHALRPSDIVARIGGDEFLVLLEGVDETSARLVGERILHGLAQPYGGPSGVQPSASLGLALTRDFRADSTALIARADAAMYTAKRAGGARLFADS